MKNPFEGKIYVNPEGEAEARKFTEEEEKKSLLKKHKKHKTLIRIDSEGITIKKQKARFVADEKGEILDLDKKEDK